MASEYKYTSQPSTRAKVAGAVAKGMNAAKDAVSNFAAQTKAVAGIGKDAADAAGQVGRNIKQENDSAAPPKPTTAADAVPKLSKGAKIKKTRVVRVHAKEAVLPKGRAKKAGKIGLLKGLQTI